MQENLKSVNYCLRVASVGKESGRPEGEDKKGEERCIREKQGVLVSNTYREGNKEKGPPCKETRSAVWESQTNFALKTRLYKKLDLMTSGGEAYWLSQLAI